MLSLQEGGGDVAQREVVAMEEAFETVGGRGVGLGGALSIFPLTKYPTKSKSESVTHRICATLSGFIRMVFVPYFPLYFVASLSLVLFKPGAETVTVTGEGVVPARRMARHEPLNSF